MDNSLASTFSPVHKEFENPFFISILGVSYKCLFMLCDDGICKNLFSINLPSYWNTVTVMGKKLHLGSTCPDLYCCISETT